MSDRKSVSENAVTQSRVAERRHQRYVQGLRLHALGYLLPMVDAIERCGEVGDELRPVGTQASHDTFEHRQVDTLGLSSRLPNTGVTAPSSTSPATRSVP